MISEMTVYAIRHNETGKYWGGGVRKDVFDNLSNSGKIWKKKNNARCAIINYNYYRGFNKLKLLSESDFSIVEIRFTNSVEKIIPFKE